MIWLTLSSALAIASPTHDLEVGASLSAVPTQPARGMGIDRAAIGLDVAVPICNCTEILVTGTFVTPSRLQPGGLTAEQVRDSLPEMVPMVAGTTGLAIRIVPFTARGRGISLSADALAGPAAVLYRQSSPAALLDDASTGPLRLAPAATVGLGAALGFGRHLVLRTDLRATPYYAHALRSVRAHATIGAGISVYFGDGHG